MEEEREQQALMALKLEQQKSTEKEAAKLKLE